MVQNLVESLLGMFEVFKNIPFGNEISIFFISLMPMLELRGGLIAASLLNVSPITSFFICIIGNLLPIPFILLFITAIFEKLKKTKRFSNIIIKLEQKALNKKSQIEKYEFWGIVIFVGIPLPGTGAWTGALIAALLEMDKKKAFFAISIGVLMASIIMMIISYGILGYIVK